MSITVVLISLGISIIGGVLGMFLYPNLMRVITSVQNKWRDEDQLLNDNMDQLLEKTEDIQLWLMSWQRIRHKIYLNMLFTAIFSLVIVAIMIIIDANILNLIVFFCYALLLSFKTKQIIKLNNAERIVKRKICINTGVEIFDSSLINNSSSVRYK